jgi:hypothetical protein
MPRQNFLSKDFFVEVSESEARRSLLNLTQYSPHIKFIKENTLTHSFRFLYQPLDSKKHFQIDISLLPLDNTFTQVGLHLAYTNGQVLTTDAGAKTVLLLFEHTVHAALRGDTTEATLNPLKESFGMRKGLGQFFNTPVGSWLFGRKKGIANI